MQQRSAPLTTTVLLSTFLAKEVYERKTRQSLPWAIAATLIMPRLCGKFRRAVRKISR